MTNTAHVLIVDDEVNIRNALVTLLERKGYQARGVGTAEEALDLLESTGMDLVITDLRMPGIGGMEFVRRLHAKWPCTEVVVMTAYGSIETAVEAMRSGAYDYLTKPIDRERFPIVVEKAIERHLLAIENQQLRDRLETKTRFERMVGESEPMQHVYQLVEMVAASDVTVLLTGESGTGKELVARAIHHQSSRSNGPLITVNCGALPENLFESELFGYEKGAFTGALGTKAGRFELAHGGTSRLPSRFGDQRIPPSGWNEGRESGYQNNCRHQPQLGRNRQARRLSRGSLLSAQCCTHQITAAARTRR
jgi:DNA-binding NtrC family response regulator